MVKFLGTNDAEKAGDYNLSNIDLINHRGEAVDLKYVVVEMNIYESIYKSAVTGTIVRSIPFGFIWSIGMQIVRHGQRTSRNFHKT